MAQASIDDIFYRTFPQIGRPPKRDPAAVQIRDLTVFAYSQGLTWWAYRGLMNAGRRAAQALQPGYFGDAADMLGHGDLIWVPGADDALQLFVLKQNGKVTVRPMMVAADIAVRSIAA